MRWPLPSGLLNINTQGGAEVDPLKILFNTARTHVGESIRRVVYPSKLCSRHGLLVWERIYAQIDQLNKSIIEDVSGRDGVYAIWLLGRTGWALKYVGQTQGSTARQRFRAHMVWTSQNNEGKTGSQFLKVREAVMHGKQIGFSFVEIRPGTLRHYIESNLIGRHVPEWNQHGVRLKVSMRRPWTVPC